MDHPREYGENPYPFRPCGRPAGSSPRIRGEFLHGGTISCREGIIPANTGRISLHHQRLSTTWDHPREYGENGM